MAVSRFADVDALTSRFLGVDPTPEVLVWAGRAKDSLGDRAGALAFYERALPMLEAVGDRSGQATTLNNIGNVHQNRGDLDAALTHYQQALPISEAVGDRARQATTLNNLAMIYRAQGQLADAAAELELVVEHDRAIQHPNLADDTAMLEQVKSEQAHERS